MTMELFYLFLTAILLSLLWLPYIAGQIAYRGLPDREYYRTEPSTEGLPDWVRRANRAHLNLVEQFGPFAALVLIGAVLDISTEATALWSAVFFWARVAHAVVYIGGITVLWARTVAFAVANLSILFYAVEIWRVATQG